MHRPALVVALALTLVACPGERPGPDPCVDVEPTSTCMTPVAAGAACTLELAATGTSCDDADACTQGDSCNAVGMCVGARLECSDGDDCTEDVCSAGDCTSTFVAGIACDDGDPCSWADVCDGDSGACTGPVSLCGDCVVGEEDTCDDAFTPDNACDGTVVCTPDGCRTKPGSVVVCDTETDTPCRHTGCDPATGSCATVKSEVGSPCDDDNACTAGETCDIEGQCTGGSLLSCDDDDPCTEDFCDHSTQLLGCVSVTTCSCESDLDCAQPPFGCLVSVCVEEQCVFQTAPDGLRECDNRVCTVGDTCEAGVCAPGSLFGCDDGNPCTTDACDEDTDEDTAECVSTPLGLEAACDDDEACTTKDACDGAGGCAGVPLPCDDGNVCNGTETCDDGACAAGEDLVCNDDNGCTTDSCDALEGCRHEDTSAPCDDASKCTTGDTCQPDGLCTGTAVDCDDGVECTVDTCDSDDGCISAAEDGACDDGNPCTDDACDDDADCLHAANSATCDDGSVCTDADACVDKVCAGVAIDCDDGDQCTVDTCGDEGCVHVITVMDCDDGDACTDADVCDLEGACLGSALTCDDGVDCTTDGCEPETGCTVVVDDGECTDGSVCTDEHCDASEGCVVEANEAACDDGDLCTEDDSCADSACGGQPVVCDDGDACTDDACDASSGECATEDVVCDDGIDCTTDSCDAESGCVFVPDDGECDDDNLCTTDVCNVDAGGCAWAPVDCDDGNPCTSESCTAIGGCNAVPAYHGEPCVDAANCDTPGVCAAGECLPPIVDVAVTSEGVCVVCQAGQIRCWGTIPWDSPEGLSGEPNVVWDLPWSLGVARQIELEEDFGCVREVGGAKCFGAAGSTGTGLDVGHVGPATVKDLAGGSVPGVQALAIGFGGGCVVTVPSPAQPDQRHVMCWGENLAGNASPFDPSAQLYATEVAVPPPSDVIALGSAGCSLGLVDRHLSCWKSTDPSGLLGDGPADVAPVIATVVDPSGAAPLASVADVSVDEFHACAVQKDGTTLCWGNGTLGQLGVDVSTPGMIQSTPTPVIVSEAPAADRVFAFFASTCVRRQDNCSLTCWGMPLDGSGEEPTVPYDYALPEGVPASTLGIARPAQAAPETTCTWHADGTVVCRGAADDIGPPPHESTGVNVMSAAELCPE